RTYTNSYLTGSNYTTSRYIYNRLLTSTVQGPGGTPSVTLVTNVYDGTALTNVATIKEHDPVYGTSLTWRGNVTSSTTLTGTTATSYDIGGNAVSSTVNNLTTTATMDSVTNFVAPAA